MGKKMIEQGFNYTDSTIKEMTDFFETRVENLELKDNKNESPTAVKKSKKSHKRRKIDDSNFSVVESNEQSTESCHPFYTTNAIILRIVVKIYVL